MIISRTPFRVSFCGGGSDMRGFYRRAPGAVVSMTIDRYMYIMIHPYFHDKIRIKYSKLEDVDRVGQIKHTIVRACLRELGVAKGIEIASIADVPAGTGLGSSSAFAVGLLHVLLAHQGKPRSKAALARAACRVEIDLLKEPIGKQDQYAASFGGLNLIRFHRDERVSVEPIACRPEVRKRLEKHLLLFYVGKARRAGRILRAQGRNLGLRAFRDRTAEMVRLAEEMRDALLAGRLGRFAEILHESWTIKKTLAPRISDPRLDAIYARGLEAGALGGKLLGAGGGGFFLFFCPPRSQDDLRRALGLRELKFGFDREGSKIIFREGRADD